MNRSSILQQAALDPLISRTFLAEGRQQLSSQRSKRNAFAPRNGIALNFK
jgi:hypothetical protein